MKRKEEIEMKAVRTSLGLRDVLFDEIDSLRNGTTTSQKASAMARLASQIVSSVRIEIDHQMHVQSVLNASSKITPSATLALGSTPDADRE